MLICFRNNPTSFFSSFPTINDHTIEPFYIIRKIKNNKICRLRFDIIQTIFFSMKSIERMSFTTLVVQNIHWVTATHIRTNLNINLKINNHKKHHEKLICKSDQRSKQHCTLYKINFVMCHIW